jgi:hypothetical protein
MLPLAGDKFPATAAQLTDALQGGLAARGFAPTRVTIDAPSWPRAELLAIDLSGARVTRNIRLPEPALAGSQPLRCARLEILGAPLFFEGTPVRLRLDAEEVVFDQARSALDEPLLAMQTAARGRVEIEIARPDLEAMLQRVATQMAGDHGVEVKKATMELTAHHSRMLAVRAEVTAKMFVMSAAVKLAGEVAVDDALHARLSNLRVSADGMVGALVNTAARPFLEKWENREFALLAFPLGGMTLRDVAVRGGDSLHLEAHFGSA